MSTITRKNVVANLAGRALSAALAFATVPIVIHLLGVESYGLIGVFATLQAIFGLLDLGLSGTMTREMARRSASPEERKSCRDFVRTVEVFYWGIGIVIGALTIAGAPYVAHRWIHVRSLSPQTAQNAVILMGIALAVQWPLSLYEGAIGGLQRQVLGNVVSLTTTVIRTAAAIGVLFVVSRSIEAYLIAQAGGYFLQTFVTAIVVWRSLPPAEGPVRVHIPILADVWRFAAGISATSIIGIVLTQIDKVVVSKVLDLREFAFYTVGATAAAGLYYIVGPIFTAVYPQMTQRAAAGDPTLASFYHRSSQLLGAVVFPVAATMAFFSRDVLLLWTRDAQTATAASTVMALLVTGTALHGMMHIPYALQLAYGWTSLTMITNAVMAAVLAPLMFGIARRFGAPGAAAVWLLLNCAYVLVVVPLMHRRYLKGETAAWYVRDLLLPLLASTLAAAIWRAAAPRQLPLIQSAAVVAGCIVTAFIAAVVATPAAREELVARGSALALRVRER